MSSPTNNGDDSSKKSAKPVDPPIELTPDPQPGTKKPAPIRTGHETD